MPARLLLIAAAAALAAAPAQDRDDLKRARAAFRKGEYDTAEKIFERLAASRPEAWEPRAGLVRLRLEQGRRDDAARACDEFLKTSSGHAGARIARAAVALDQGDPDRALRDLEPLLDDVRARALAALALEALDRVDEASRRAEPLVEIYNRRRDDFMKEELFAVAQGLAVYARYSGNATVYKQVVQLVLPDILKADPGDAWVHAFLGRCLLEKYNAAEAARSFEEALEANPRCVPALVGQGRLLLGSGRTPPALALAAQALQINPSSVEARLLRAEAHLAAADPRAAVAEIDKGLALLPRSARLLSLRAAARRVQEDPAFEEDVRKALEINPRSPRPWWEIARALIAGGRRQFDDAQAAFRKALELNGAIPELLVEYGLNALRVGDEETGRTLLEEANKKDPFHVRVNNTVNLLQDFERNFDLLTPPHYRIRIARAERRWMEGPVAAELDRAWTEMSRRYRGAPREPVLVEVFGRHADFSVRTAGVPGLGALGACFGRVVTTLSPRARQGSDLPAYRWSAVLWHEMAHCFSLELSRYRVPSWFTEGLATYEEELGFPAGRREADLRILEARRSGELHGVQGLEADAPTPDPILTVYLQGARICAFIAHRHGFEAVVKILRAYGEGKKTSEAFRDVLGQSLEDFDKAFFAWLDAELGKFRLRRPPSEDLPALLAKASAQPKDAAASARLAHALLAAGKDKDAEPYARRAVEADPAHADARAALGQVLFRRRDFEESIPHLEKGTDDYHNWDALGRAYAERERWKEAAAAFRKALECYPGYHDDSAWRRLNEALVTLKDLEGALRAFEGMVAADPLDFRNRLKLARLYEERGDADRMRAILAQAADIETRDLALLDLQASAHRLKKEFAPATERTLAALAILEAPEAKDDPQGKADRLCSVGEDWRAQGRRDKGLEYAQEALKLVSGHFRAQKLYEACKP